MDNSDEIILNSLKTNSVESYELLFKKYYKLLTMQAFYILEDEMESEDLVLAFFSEIWENRLYNNIQSSLKAYLQVSVRNKCFKILDKRKTASKRMDSYVYTLQTDVDEVEDKNEYVSTAEIQLVLSDFPRQRLQAFTLVYMQEKRYKEAALEMGISINSIKTHLKLAIKELRKRLVVSANS